MNPEFSTDLFAAEPVIIAWDIKYEIGIPLIDKQHEKLVQLVNDLHMACRQSVKTASRFFIETAHETVNYLHHHFSTEEKMMLLFEYKGYPEHKTEHENFSKEIQNQIRLVSIRRQLDPDIFVRLIKDWLVSHITKLDNDLAKYILSLEDHEKLQQLFPKSA